MNRKNDSTIFRNIQSKLYTGVICDVLDELGYRNQAMREDIHPLEPSMSLVGRAKTLLAVDVYEIGDNPYDIEIEAMDSIKENEVVVACTNQSKRNGLWGELLSTAAKMRGGNGAVIDGLIRDSKRIRELQFPVYCTGYKPVDSKGRGKIINYDCVVEVGGVTVKPGDIVFADFDGVVIIPYEVFEKTVELALEKVKSENNTRKELLEGKLLREVFNKYGVL